MLRAPASASFPPEPKPLPLPPLVPLPLPLSSTGGAPVAGSANSSIAPELTCTHMHDGWAVARAAVEPTPWAFLWELLSWPLQPWPAHRPRWREGGVAAIAAASTHPLTLSNSQGQGGVLADTQLPMLPDALCALPLQPH